MRVGRAGDLLPLKAKPTGVAGICKIVEDRRARPTQFGPDEQVLRRREQPEDPAMGLPVTVAPVRALPFVSLDETATVTELAV